MNLEERRTRIAVRQEAQANRSAQKRFQDLGITLGPLTAAMCEDASWRIEDHLYPFSQVYADEIEEILRFANAQRQHGRYWPRLVARRSQRDSALDELRIARHFCSHKFEIVKWEPLGQNGHRGEYLIARTCGAHVFVEVKGPRWEGELKDWEISSGRASKPKDLYAEARRVAPSKRIQFEIDKSYNKFAPMTSNLLVMAGYRGFMSLDAIQAQEALYNPNLSGCFAHSAYPNLGGVGLFSMGNGIDETAYAMTIFKNPFALKPLPDALGRVFTVKLPELMERITII
jgi:hypothetical protein